MNAFRWLEVRLLHSIFSRYFKAAKVLDYLPRDAVWWTGLVACGVLYELGGGFWSGLITPPYLLFLRWLSRDDHFKVWRFTLYTCLMEVCVFLNVFTLSGSFIAWLAGANTPQDTWGWALMVIGSLIHTYVLADLFWGPRPRKRVKVSIRQRQPQFEGV